MDLIDDFQKRIDERMAEIQPLVQEYHALQQLRSAITSLDPEAVAAHVSAFPLPGGAADLLDGNGFGDVGGSRARGKRQQSRGAAGKRTGRTSPARREPEPEPEPSGADYERAALELIATEPGLTASQMAERLNVPVSALFRLLPPLQRSGRIRKQGKGFSIA